MEQIPVDCTSDLGPLYLIDNQFITNYIQQIEYLRHLFSSDSQQAWDNLPEPRRPKTAVFCAPSCCGSQPDGASWGGAACVPLPVGVTSHPPTPVPDSEVLSAELSWGRERRHARTGSQAPASGRVPARLPSLPGCCRGAQRLGPVGRQPGKQRRQGRAGGRTGRPETRGFC